MTAGDVIRKFFKWFFISINLIVCLMFLLACFAPYINPNKFAFIGFLTLSLPYLATLLFFSFLFWIIAKPLLALIPLLTLAIGWKQIHSLFAFNIPPDFVLKKNDSALRIVDWNVGSMYGLSSNTEIKKTDRLGNCKAYLKATGGCYLPAGI